MKRLFDTVASVTLMIAFAPAMLVIAVVVRATSPGPAIYRAHRVGRDGVLFRMPKFRTMRIDTPQVATHLLSEPKRWMTPVGPILRRLSLDELPQLFSVARGEMSLVGPRPALFNQEDLIAMRQAAGVSGLKPGVTGWAQINGRDELSNEEKVRLDAEYGDRRSLLFDLWILLRTALGCVFPSGVVEGAPAETGTPSRSQAA
ncbi:MAG: sugar transferase [Planctomycetota bacterium]